MVIDPLIFKGILVLMSLMVAIMGFIGGLGVKALWRISDDIGEMKTGMAVQKNEHSTLKDNHKDLKEQVVKLDDKVDKIHDHVFKVKY